MRTFAVLLVLACTISAAQAATLHVPSEYSTIQAAIDAAMSGDKVLVDEGVYSGPGNIDLELGRRTINILSVSGPEFTIIDCRGEGRAFDIHDRAAGFRARVDGFTLRGGHAAYGGAVIIDDASAVFNNCIFEFNTASYTGGAVYLGTSTDEIRFSDCRFLNNTAGPGPGTFGGAIHKINFLDPVRLSGCLLAGNTSDVGGAISTVVGPFFITNCTIVNNSARVGSGCYTLGSLETDKCVIAYNHGSAAVKCGMWAFPIMTCTDIFGNEGGDWTDCIADQYGTDGNISQDPAFCDAEWNDFSVTPNSPCVPENNPCGEHIGSQGIGCVGRVCGDVNRDGELSGADVLFLQETYFEHPFTALVMEVADADCDGWITIADLILLAGYVHGYGPAPCCAEPPPPPPRQTDPASRSPVGDL